MSPDQERTRLRGMSRVTNALLLTAGALTLVATALGCATPPTATYADEVSAFRAAGKPLLIYELRSGRPNSAGGVDVFVKFINTSSKTIKYARFNVTPFNAVGDPVRSSIGRRGQARLAATGPYGPGAHSESWYWPNTWYNSTIRSVRLDRVEIDFMDGSSFRAEKQAANAMLLKNGQR